MFNENRSFWSTITNMLILSNLLAYMFTSIAGRNFITTKIDLIMLLGQSNFLVIKGWHWQLFTSMFIHVNIIHLLGNMLFLLIFGLKAEELFSKKLYLGIYFSSGLLGNLLSLLMGPYTISAGASGAIFGLFGACVTYMRKTAKQSILGALIYSFYLFIITMGANVNFLSHFGGLIAGLTIGYLQARKEEKYFY
ncbi:MAG: rhomboid family intramembrane serine protease [Candidatus Bathyarchaeia archaeon]